VIYFQSLTREELQELLLPLSKTPAQARYRAKQIFMWVYRRFITDWDEMTDVSKATRAWMKENVELFQLNTRTTQEAQDGTMKFLWNLPDSKTIESVIIPAALQNEEEDRPTPEDSVLAGKLAPEQPSWGRLTACISSQVGCAMACKFCLTGVQGLDRHLQTHEIVTQVYELRKIAPITNIVFMGMGEPLHNLENVIKACEILIDPTGLGLSRRKVTVSTSGLVPAIDELGKRVPVSLAVSLNGTTDEQRSVIMPVNKRWPIAELLDACRRYPLGHHRRVTFEYVLLKGLNDSLEDAARLLKLVRGIPCKINLIPFNEHPASEFKRPEDQTVRVFQRFLVDRGLTATVRISRGRDILAACGQLRSIFGTARGSEKHKDWNRLTTSVG
jgi:23S rRNA (adenine2503-C2)-methyltransferase